jgi:CRP/FNR family transcriptional regulator, cyclic AMP receptor protein
MLSGFRIGWSILISFLKKWNVTNPARESVDLRGTPSSRSNLLRYLGSHFIFGVEIAIMRGGRFIGAKEASVGKLARDGFDPKAFLSKVGTGKTIVEFEKNQQIFGQGDVADAVFYIQKGSVKLTVLSEHGKEAVVGILEPGQFFGEGCLNGHPLRIATTIAMEQCVITSITKEAMIATLHNEPKFSELFMAYLLTRNSRVEEDLIDQLFNSSEKRLARLLLLLAHFGKEGRPQPILLDMSQETLAEMIGTTRSRVSFFMNKFRKLGLISYNGKIEVHNSLLNAVLHEKPEIERDDPSSKV